MTENLHRHTKRKCPSSQAAGLYNLFFFTCPQVSLRLALLPSWSRTFTVGPCTFEGCRRLTAASTAVWPAAQPEPPLPLLPWRLEVGPHNLQNRSYRPQKCTQWKLVLCLAFSTAGPLFAEAPVDVMANIGENVTLPCTARGSPQPVVTWRRQDGGHILSSTDSHGRIMQLDSGHLLIQGEVAVKHYRAWSYAVQRRLL